MLTERLLRRQAADAPRTRIPPRPAGATAALSFAQERLWFLDQLAPGGAAYNVVRVYEVAGDLAPAILARALGEIAARHEPLRTRFPLRDGAPAALAGDAAAAIPVPVADLGRLPREAGRREAERLYREAARRAFDLGRGPLLRVLYLACGSGRSVLALTLHHIAADGWSLDLLFRELQAIYRARLAGAEPALPSLPIRYSDFAHWQRERLQGEALAKLLGSWRERLAGAPASLELPADRPRVPSPHAAGGLARAEIGPPLALELRQLASRRGATPFMVLLAAFYAVLHRLTGNEALIVGVPAAGRTHSELEPLIGMFVNTLALRVDVGPELSGEQLLARTREAALAAHSGQELPFEKLVEALAPERSLAAAPFVQAMFALEVPAPELVLPGAVLRRLEVWGGGAKLDLDVTFADLGAGGLAATTIYDRGLFDAPTVERLHGYYLRLLAALAAEPRRPLAELPLLAGEERHQVLCEWNDSAAGAGAAEGAAEGAEETDAASFPGLFAALAARFPERMAAAWRDERLTFGELDRRAGRLALRIAAQLPPGRLAALALPRGLDFLTAMLAVWKAGSAYLPLDLEQPPAHLARILAASGAGLVLAPAPVAAGPAGVALERTLGELAPAGRPPVLPVAAPAAEPSAAAPYAAPAPVRLSSHDLAYVIFTSGSTGTPKGVMLEHGGMLNHLLAKVESLGIAAADRIAQNAPATFDISIWQLLAPLLAGGEVEIVPDEVARDPARLLNAVDRHSITILEVVPSLLRFLIDHLEEGEAAGRGRPTLAALRVVVPTGEALPVELCRRWLALYPRVPLLNAYGPTECSDDVTHRLVRRAPAGPHPHVPLGRPIRNLRVLVLDRRMRPAPIGVVGEVYCAGRGVGRGYLGDGALTALSFLPDPFAGTPGSRLYRTGDLGRWLPAGELEFLGRADHQVKVRGFRIELGDIEAALARHPAVRAASALAFTDAAGGRRLIAWVACQPAGDPAAADLRGYLAALLPDYMVPWIVAPLPELPLTSAGKIDRRALERLSRELAASVPMRERTAPRTALERELAGLWLAALGPLGVRELGVREDFFELGGNSLTGAVLINRLQERLGEAVPVAAIFNAPTIERLARWIEEHHPAAAGRLEVSAVPATAAAAAAPTPTAAIPRRAADPGEVPPASFAQERLWFLDRLQPGSTLYNVPVAFWLEGTLDAAALARALGEIVRRHEALRTTLQAAAAGPMQVIAPPPGAGARHLPLADLGALPRALAEPEALRLARREAGRPFDLAAGPLFRTALLRLGARRHALLLNLHHVIADGWSLGVLYRELEALYAAAVGPAAGSLAAVLPEPPLQYADFAVWQRGWLTGEAIASQLAFWREALAGAPRLLELPAARPRPAVQGHRGASRSLVLPPALAAALETFARRQGATFFLTLLAAFDLLLYRHTGQDDLVVGTPVAGRNRSQLERLVGLYINTLALRTRLGGDPTFPDLLARVRAAAAAAFACQDLPFERLVAELQPARNLSSSPLFQVVFMVVDAALDAPTLAGLRVAPLPIDRGTTKFDLAFACEERADGLRILAEYDRDLFDPADVARLLAAFEALLGGIAAGAERRISAFPAITWAMRHQVLREWNDTAARADRRSTLHGLFERQAKRTPAALAVVLGGGPEAPRLTYRDLDRVAACWAHALRAAGVGLGSLVAVYMDRCLEMVPALLAILKTGAAYVPVSTSLPAARVSHILSIMNVRHAVTQPSRRADLESRRGATPLAHVLTLDLLARDARAAAAAPPPPLPPVDPQALAYVIFTSGSTGTPKGVLVQHAPAAALIGWVNATFGVGARDRLLFTTSLSFDLSVYDVFGLLAAGGTVRIATGEELRDPQRLARVLAEEPITFWDSAPAALQQLVPFFPAGPGDGGAGAAAGPTLSLVFLSGDWVPLTLPGRVREAFPRARVVALGGATEATVWSNHHPIAAAPPEWKSIPYGRPIAGARYHVLDHEQLPCPIGVPGDLYIGGRCLSIGYAGAPELTAWKYLPDPFAAEGGGRLYRTGDRARHWADGTLEFLGRGDHQVKVRGFRIELGEIEAVLGEHPAVRETVVLAREDTPGDQRLVAYFIPRGDQAAAAPPPATAELRGFLAARLPDYMVPSAFVSCAAWPLSATGKLDRQSLPPPGGAAGGRDRGAEPPRGPLEEAIARVWEAVIGLDAVGRAENFFDAGGHSLLMVRVQTRLRQALGREVSMVELFQHPTVAALAGFLAPLLEPPGAKASASAAAPLAATPLAAAAAVAAAAPTEQRAREIAIVGMAGRFPGAPDLDTFWDNLRGGVESIRFFSREELLAAGVPPALAADPRYVPARGVLDGAELFDAEFFDYSPREAQITDPQQRLFLECAWAALEDAGYAGAPVPGGVGVFAGAAESTHAAALRADPELMRTVGAYQAAIGNQHDYLPSRVSYKLDLEGPSLAVQTACSTSLVAVHLACRSLLDGECALALAGGVAVRGSQREGYLWEEGSIASPDGHTRAFDAAARGTVTGSGVGIVVLKRLDLALAAGDRVRAVIRGSAVNNDGSKKPGFTAPSVEGQARVIRRAHQAAGVPPETISYVEAHGTGTEMGDPIEIAGLTRAFRAGTGRERFCAVGSVKTNIGHLDAAAGVAGLIKTVLALEHRLLPPSLHFTRPNPNVDFASSPFYVNAAAAAWPRGAAPRRAGVSAFGIGGTNAHLVLEEAPAPPPAEVPARPLALLVLSARTPTALAAATANLAAHLERCRDLDHDSLADVAWTLQVGRRRFHHRRALVAAGRDDALAALTAPAGGRLLTRADPAGARAVAFAG